MRYIFGKIDDWIKKPIHKSPLKALAQATGDILYIYDDNDDLIITTNFKDYAVAFIEEYAKPGDYEHSYLQRHGIKAMKEASMHGLVIIASTIAKRREFDEWVTKEIENMIRKYKGIPLIMEWSKG